MTESSSSSSSSSTTASTQQKRRVGIACIAAFGLVFGASAFLRTQNDGSSVSSNHKEPHGLRKLQQRGYHRGSVRVTPVSVQYVGRLHPQRVYRYYPGDDDWYHGDDGYDDDGGTDDKGYEDDDYEYVYRPVPAEKVVAIEGGMGKRSSRTMADIRFNKCPPITEDAYLRNAWRYSSSNEYKEAAHSLVFPLMPEDFPLSGDKARILKRKTMADSLIVTGDFQLHGAVAEDYLGLLKPPDLPSSDPKNPFWDNFREVVKAQESRRGGSDAYSTNHWPSIWSSRSLADIAASVHQEYPGSNQQAFLESLFEEGIEVDHGMVPFRSVVDFVGMEIRIAALNTWVIDAVAPISFMLKWHVGAPRPEEIAWMVASGEFSDADGVPSDIIESVRSMGLAHSTNFTAYPEGSPTHPSWPAQHAAGSSVSFWLPALYKLTPQQYCEALRVDYGVAYARTIAGVHYPQDNLAGLNLGQAVLREKLPGHLSESYGCDSAKLQDRLDRLSFDWETFDPAQCTIDGTPVSKRLSFYNEF